MNERDYQESTEEQQDVMTKLFEQEIKTVKDLLEENGPDAEMRIFKPRKDAYLKAQFKK